MTSREASDSPFGHVGADKVQLIGGEGSQGEDERGYAVGEKEEVLPYPLLAHQPFPGQGFGGGAEAQPFFGEGVDDLLGAEVAIAVGAGGEPRVKEGEGDSEVDADKECGIDLSKGRDDPGDLQQPQTQGGDADAGEKQDDGVGVGAEDAHADELLLC